jgi:hypothetical protein
MTPQTKPSATDISSRLPELINNTNTVGLVASLQLLFDKVMSGNDYNKEQVKSATGITNAMVKAMRFEFDVYKFFSGRTSN